MNELLHDQAAVSTGPVQCQGQTFIAVAQKVPEDALQEDEKLLLWYDQALTRMEAKS